MAEKKPLRKLVALGDIIKPGEAEVIGRVVAGMKQDEKKNIESKVEEIKEGEILARLSRLVRRSS